MGLCFQLYFTHFVRFVLMHEVMANAFGIWIVKRKSFQQVKEEQKWKKKNIGTNSKIIRTKGEFKRKSTGTKKSIKHWTVCVCVCVLESSIIKTMCMLNLPFFIVESFYCRKCNNRFHLRAHAFTISQCSHFKSFTVHMYIH